MTTQNPPPNDIDISRPNVARIYDYLLGGKDNFAGPDFRSAGQPRSLRGAVGRKP